MSRRPRNKRNPDHANSSASQSGSHASRHGGSVPRKRGPHALPKTDASRPRSFTAAGKPVAGKPVAGKPRRPTKRRPGGAQERSQGQRSEPDRSQPRQPARRHDQTASQDRSRKRETERDSSPRERDSSPRERDSRPRQPSYAQEAFVAEDAFSHDVPGYYLDDPPSSETELGIGTRVVPPAMGVAFDSSDDDAFTDLDGFGGSAFADTRPSTDSEMQATIQALEARLDGLIRQASEFTHEDDGDDAASARPDTRATKAARAHGTDPHEADEDDQSAVEATRELLSSEYYRRQWGRVGLRRRAEHIDDFGHDPVYERRLAPLLDFLCQHYFRCETQGVDNIPAEGRCLIVANHSGTLPLDGVMLRRAVRLRHPAKRELRWLAEDFIFYLPFVGVLMNRLGAVRACQENAQRLLMQESLVVAFPEGTKGVKKLFRQRYQLQRFGRGGYIRLCLRTGTPIVPCAIIGAEETNPLLFRLEQLPRLIGWPYLPVTPTFPLLGPLGLLPAPTKWKMIFGEPLDFDQYGPADANDHVLVGRLSEQVQAAIRDMLARGLAERNGVWLG